MVSGRQAERWEYQDKKRLLYLKSGVKLPELGLHPLPISPVKIGDVPESQV